MDAAPTTKDPSGYITITNRDWTRTNHRIVHIERNADVQKVTYQTDQGERWIIVPAWRKLEA